MKPLSLSHGFWNPLRVAQPGDASVSPNCRSSGSIYLIRITPPMHSLIGGALISCILFARKAHHNLGAIWTMDDSRGPGTIWVPFGQWATHMDNVRSGCHLDDGRFWFILVYLFDACKFRCKLNSMNFDGQLEARAGSLESQASMQTSPSSG